MYKFKNQTRFNKLKNTRRGPDARYVSHKKVNVEDYFNWRVVHENTR